MTPGEFTRKTEFPTFCCYQWLFEGWGLVCRKKWHIGCELITDTISICVLPWTGGSYVSPKNLQPQGALVGLACCEMSYTSSNTILISSCDKETSAPMKVKGRGHLAFQGNSPQQGASNWLDIDQ